jgi:hypothetical protein
VNVFKTPASPAFALAFFTSTLPYTSGRPIWKTAAIFTVKKKMRWPAFEFYKKTVSFLSPRSSIKVKPKIST